ncbi:MAG: beta-propeller domain-containing protein [Candidatus Hadarchaeales archaeon]
MAEDYRRWERRVKGKFGPIKTGAVLILFILLTISSGWLWLRSPGREVPAQGLIKFSSEAEFFQYLSKSQEWLSGYWRMGGYLLGKTPLSPIRVLEGSGEREEASRISETTIQVKGIDEPDIVKTNGRHLYFSGYWSTKIIRAFPPSELSVVSRLERNGELLLLENLLILLSHEGITGYDVSDPSSPRELWNVELKADLVSARLYRGRIYLVTSTPLGSPVSLPLQPLKAKDTEVLVKATDIYHPPIPIPVDSVYTAFILNPREGRVEKSVSFVGYSGASVVYMSRTSLYLAYTSSASLVETYYHFLSGCPDLVPANLMRKVERLMGYDLSDAAKMVELEVLLSSVDLPWEELWKRWEGYVAERKRELETTHIVKIALENFEIVAQAEVPGRLLNQFSLDEEGGYLRLATTVEPWMFRWKGESTNDVYVLDHELKVVGSLTDLGSGEEIYAVRFIGDKGYVVTFRETDPLHVIDLSHPSKPEVVGELKVPGYSSYLHPINDNLLLGIGRENWKVKVSLFDLSSPSQPIELDKLLLEEYWSEILETHHAFLLDPDHEVFFLPAFGKGYVISYGEKDLEVVRVVENRAVRRAVYLEDYLYVISEENLTVLNERTWEIVNEIEL